MVGRIGCQVSGDGDWGILNSAYVTNAESKALTIDNAQFRGTLEAYKTYYLDEFKTDSLDAVPHKSIKAPSWMPVWMVAYSYPHNVLNNGFKIPSCQDHQYCNQLPIPVFPTPFYETIMIVFFAGYGLSGRAGYSRTMFAVYLAVNGVERAL
jgi:hypothetical protein